jgi:hypothetical protein
MKHCRTSGNFLSWSLFAESEWKEKGEREERKIRRKFQAIESLPFTCLGNAR